MSSRASGSLRELGASRGDVATPSAVQSCRPHSHGMLNGGSERLLGEDGDVKELESRGAREMNPTGFGSKEALDQYYRKRKDELKAESRKAQSERLEKRASKKKHQVVAAAVATRGLEALLLAPTWEGWLQVQ